ncbi:MAG: cell division ATP-binding protein FtsE [Micrococcales bacterium]|nr:cell division ATP-binding protein FtsE [Micrococcales bacterium]
MIRFENVVKAYPRTARPALDGVDLNIPQGQFAYLVGASGSGKSTVIRLLLREERVTSGRIQVAGRDLSRIRRREIPRLRRDLGVVFQDFRLLPDKTIYDNVAYVMHVLGTRPKQVREVVPATLELVGLSAMSRRLPHELSGGEQQRVAIARAVVKKPRLLLADEPTGNLDPGTSREIVRLLGRINESGTTVLMATHDDSIVNELRRRVIELDAGRVVRDEADGAYFAPRPQVDPAVAHSTSAEPPTATAESVNASPGDAQPVESTSRLGAQPGLDGGAAHQGAQRQATAARALIPRRDSAQPEPQAARAAGAATATEVGR